MLTLSARMLRHRLGSTFATLVALAAGVMILLAMGVLVESGLRFQPTPQRYAGADVIVAHRSLTVTTKQFGDTSTSRVALPEPGAVPAALVERIRAVPGVSTVVADHSVPVVVGSTPATAHGWGSAALAPTRLTAGTAPVAADEVALGMRPGQTVQLSVGGELRTFRITGTTEAGVFFADSFFAGDRIEAIGVIGVPGANVVLPVRRLAEAAGVESYAGSDLGRAEQADDGDLLVEVGAAFGGYVAMLIGFVVAGTIGLSVRHRRRDLALLRAVAATPGQVRRMIMAEAGLLSLLGAAIGVPAGLLAAHWVHDQLVHRGFLAADFPMAGGALAAVAAVLVTVLVAVLSALAAARRITAIRPTEALGEAAVEPSRSGRVRLVSGLVALAGAVSAGSVTVGTDGQAALAGAVGMLYLFVAAVALLAPWINRTGARLLSPVLRRVWGAGGYLAGANLRANAQGMTTVLTALVLSVGFGGSVWFLQDNLERAVVTQSRSGLLAQQALVAPTGLPDAAVSMARAIPGVQAVTGVRHTSVLVPQVDTAEPVTAQAVDPASVAQTMDLKVRSGRLADLRGETVAVSSIQGAHVGDRMKLWLGDGTPKTLRVVAVYDRGLGFGDLTLPADLLPASPNDQILLRTAPGTDLSSLVARYPGSRLVPTAELTGRLQQDLAVSAWLNKLLIGVMVGYAALAAANTMVMAALARRRELSLLRLVGVTSGQVKRMVYAEQAGLLGAAVVIGAAIAAATLSTVVNAVTGSYVPYVPVTGWVAVLGGTAVLALGATVLPIGRLLRVRPVEGIGIRE